MSLEHFDETTSIQFNDINSDREEFLKAKDSIDVLLRSAPSESVCRFNVKAVEGGFQGTLQICSAENQFKLNHEASTVSELQQTLFKKMHQDLNQWKKERSVDEITGVISLNSFSIEKEKKK